MNEDEYTLADVVRAIERLAEVYRVGFERILRVLETCEGVAPQLEP